MSKNVCFSGFHFLLERSVESCTAFNMGYRIQGSKTELIHSTPTISKDIFKKDNTKLLIEPNLINYIAVAI